MSPPTASDVTQVIVWTALPNGMTPDGHLALSVFVSPQLSAVMSDNSTPLLGVFHDFVNWPGTIGSAPGPPVSFTVTFAGLDPVEATLAPGSATLDSAGWEAVFDPTVTGVTPYSYEDLSSLPMTTFDAKGLVDTIAGIYGTIGAQSPTAPVLLDAVSVKRGPPTFSVIGNSALSTVLGQLETLANYSLNGVTSEIQRQFHGLRQFHSYPPTIPGVSGPDPTFSPTLPEIDFHSALSSLGSYPAVLRRFGLVFDLVVPMPAVFNVPPQTVMVTPTWTSSLTGGLSGKTLNVTPLTSITLSNSSFQAAPRGIDYVNGMLDLADATRFSVTDLDVDLAGDRLVTLSLALQSTQEFWAGGHSFKQSGAIGPPYYRSALTVPALRSNGPQVIWTNWGRPPDGLNALLANQTSLNDQLQLHLADSSSPPPTLYADDITRGHRVDVYTASEASPTWRSLHGRAGTYGLGTPVGHPATPPVTFSVVDEGFAVPSTSQQAGTLGTPNPDLHVHESFVRWPGWSLSVQRPGSAVGLDDQPLAPSGNPAVTPGFQGSNLPQLSAGFQATNIGNSGPNPFPLPKLRYGNAYRFRARAADLAGNGVPVTSTDATTATRLVHHYRYEPVPPPVLAGTAPLSIAESAMLLVLLDDQVNPITPNGRWLFPPKATEMTCEEHGMFDGFVLGSPPNPELGPDGSAATYALLAGDATTSTLGLADGILPTITGVVLDSGHTNTPYLPADALPITPWLPDPLSVGAGLVGLPNSPNDSQLVAPWSGGPWPTLNPVLLLVNGGTTRSNSFSAATDSSAAMVSVTLPPAEVAVVWFSSALSDAASSTLGIYQWIAAEFGGVANLPADFGTWLSNGQVWQLSPFRVLRMVHAVRLPLIPPRLRNPTTDARAVGDTSVGLEDENFLVDENSTSAIDFHAAWIDPYDNPLDPKSNPGDPASFNQLITGPAFRLAVPDPTPIGPESQPLTVVPPKTSFAFGMQNDQNAATHFIGDTRHHLITYSATGTSRFAEMFETSFTGTFTGRAAVKISELGINPATVAVYRHGGTAPLPASDYEVDDTAGTVRYLKNAHPTSKVILKIDFQPTTTLKGPGVAVEVLSSTRPAAPKVARITPAWELSGPVGDVSTGIGFERVGGILRVYLERPWFSSGAGELLGVVTPASLASPPTPEQQYPLYTMMGLDPITYISTTNRPWPVIPTAFGNLAEVPVVPGRPSLYTSPPQVNLVEDTDFNNPYNIWPYEVHYDEPTGTWYADVAVLPGQSGSATVLPPPGYFVRLSLVRFQPYSIVTQEVSPVTTATIAQPVPDRLVVVLQNPKDANNASVLVSVTGPGYQGWRAPTHLYTDSHGHKYVKDGDNPNSPQIYDTGGIGSEHTSTMAVDVQVHDTSHGFEGELAWKTVGRPFRLRPQFSGSTTVEWGGIGGNVDRQGLVDLPHALTSSTKMRLRISEIDFHPGNEAPAKIDTSLRRPFVAFIPLN
jgi:hypothetical protein